MPERVWQRWRGSKGRKEAEKIDLRGPCGSLLWHTYATHTCPTYTSRPTLNHCATKRVAPNEHWVCFVEPSPVEVGKALQHTQHEHWSALSSGIHRQGGIGSSPVPQACACIELGPSARIVARCACKCAETTHYPRKLERHNTRLMPELSTAGSATSSGNAGMEMYSCRGDASWMAFARATYACVGHCAP